MKCLTNEMIHDFRIMKLGYDFMGYAVKRKNELSYHHLIVPNREGGPYERWNGAILFSTPHQYLHLIESKDNDRFYYISSELIDINIKGCVDIKNIRAIDDVLCSFEHEYCGSTTSKGKKLIKEEYTHRVLRR